METTKVYVLSKVLNISRTGFSVEQDIMVFRTREECERVQLEKTKSLFRELGLDDPDDIDTLSLGELRQHLELFDLDEEIDGVYMSDVPYYDVEEQELL